MFFFSALDVDYPYIWPVLVRRLAASYRKKWSHIKYNDERRPERQNTIRNNLPVDL